MNLLLDKILADYIADKQPLTSAKNFCRFASKWLVKHGASPTTIQTDVGAFALQASTPGKPTKQIPVVPFEGDREPPRVEAIQTYRRSDNHSAPSLRQGFGSFL